MRILKKGYRNDYVNTVLLYPCLNYLTEKVKLISTSAGLFIINTPPDYALQAWFKIIQKDMPEQSGNNTYSKSSAKDWLYSRIVIYFAPVLLISKDKNLQYFS